MLREIASEDFGEEVEEHLAAITNQLSNTPSLGLLPGNPREVLELQRWSEPDNVYDRPPEGRRGHLKRLLACTILLRNIPYIPAKHPSRETAWAAKFFVQTSAATALKLCASALRLGEPFPQLSLDFLLWLSPGISDQSVSPFVAFSILLLTGSDQRLAPEVKLRALDWLLTQKAEARANLQRSVVSDRWLFGLNPYEGHAEGYEERWQSEIRQLVTDTLDASDPTQRRIAEELQRRL